jgi:hypothetical protein
LKDVAKQLLALRTEQDSWMLRGWLELMQSITQSFSAGHIMLPSPKRQARPRVLQKHLAISPISFPSLAAP